MIGIAPHLTPNQAMVLLDVYRGTFERTRHLKTVDNDIFRLIEYQYIKTAGDYLTTPLGEDRVSSMLS